MNLPEASAGVSQSRRSMSRKKRWIFRLAALALGLLGSELLSWLVVMFWLPKDDRKTLAACRHRWAESGSSRKEPNEAIHPYLGWVLDPNVEHEVPFANRAVPVNRLGFVDDGPSICRRQPGRTIIGITGGSVAQIVSVEAQDEFLQALRQSPDLRDQEIVLVRLAMSGYKQPQQLISLSYLLALGGELDVLINIDGYNELALTVAENYESRVCLSYPRSWHARMLDVVDPRDFSPSFQLLELRARRQSLARLVDRSWLRFSTAANLLWWLRDRRLENIQLALGLELQKHGRGAGYRFAQSGPHESWPDRDHVLAESVELWKRSAQQLHRLCTSNGIRYIHALQPNQYHAGSKPLSELERSKFMDPGQTYGQAVRDGFPLLIAASRELRDAGVDFHDLTQLFSHDSETIYCDEFTHLNTRGNTKLAQTLAQFVVQQNPSDHP